MDTPVGRHRARHRARASRVPRTLARARVAMADVSMDYSEYSEDDYEDDASESEFDENSPAVKSKARAMARETGERTESTVWATPRPTTLTTLTTTTTTDDRAR